MPDTATLGPWVRRFLCEHLVSERNLARNTQLSYRDTLALLLPFVADAARRPLDRLTVPDLSADRVRLFLEHLQASRGCGPSTCNQRLAAIRSFARFVASRSPEHIEWCGQIRALPLKKTPVAPVSYLEKAEVDALLDAPDRNTPRGRRERCVLTFLYNTGARASEAARFTVGDLLPVAGTDERLIARLDGKGDKTRLCPLWKTTTRQLAALADGRPAAARVFLNRCRRPFTRFGIRALVKRCAEAAAGKVPSLATKSVSPHTLRHTTATHLLRAGVDINTVRAWLGHESLSTTNIYAEIDLETKARAIALCEPPEAEPDRHWKDDSDLMAFLKGL